MPITLITADERDALPEDNDALAFVGFERICQESMKRIVARYGQDDDASDVYFEYMVQVRGAASAYGFSELVDGFEPSFEYKDFNRFYAQVVEATTKLALSGRRERSAATVALSEGDKARLRKHAQSLDEAIADSDLSPDRKAALKKRVDAFRTELDKERSNMATVFAAIGVVAAVLVHEGENVGRWEDDLIKLPKTVQAITVLMGAAKAKEADAAPDPIKLPASAKPKAIAAPTATPGRGVAARMRESLPADLDDETPF